MYFLVKNSNLVKYENQEIWKIIFYEIIVYINKKIHNFGQFQISLKLNLILHNIVIMKKSNSKNINNNNLSFNKLKKEISKLTYNESLIIAKSFSRFLDFSNTVFWTSFVKKKL